MLLAVFLALAGMDEDPDYPKWYFNPWLYPKSTPDSRDLLPDGPNSDVNGEAEPVEGDPVQQNEEEPMVDEDREGLNELSATPRKQRKSPHVPTDSDFVEDQDGDGPGELSATPRKQRKSPHVPTESDFVDDQNGDGPSELSAPSRKQLPPSPLPSDGPLAEPGDGQDQLRRSVTEAASPADTRSLTDDPQWRAMAPDSPPLTSVLVSAATATLLIGNRTDSSHPAVSVSTTGSVTSQVVPTPLFTVPATIPMATSTAASRAAAAIAHATPTLPTGLSSSEIAGFVALFTASAVILIASSAAYASALRDAAEASGTHPLLREEGLY
jgi:hypothetical protein